MSHILPVVCTTCTCPTCTWVTIGPETGWVCYKSKSEGMFTINYDQVDQKSGPTKERTKFCYKTIIIQHTLLGVFATCTCPIDYPSPVPGGAIGQSLVECLLQNITMFVTKLALERSEQNFVTKFKHVTHLAWGLYYMSMPNGLPRAQSQGGGGAL